MPRCLRAAVALVVVLAPILAQAQQTSDPLREEPGAYHSVLQCPDADGHVTRVNDALRQDQNVAAHQLEAAKQLLELGDALTDCAKRIANRHESMGSRMRAVTIVKMASAEAYFGATKGFAQLVPELPSSGGAQTLFTTAADATLRGIAIVKYFAPDLAVLRRALQIETETTRLVNRLGERAQ